MISHKKEVLMELSLLPTCQTIANWCEIEPKAFFKSKNVIIKGFCADEASYRTADKEYMCSKTPGKPIMKPF